MKQHTYNKVLELLVARILELETSLERYEDILSAHRQARENKNLKFGAGYMGLTANDDMPTQKKAPNKRQHSSDDVLILK